MAKDNGHVEKALNAVVGMFESGNLPEAVATTMIRSAERDVPCNKWSFGNKIITLLVGQTHDARGFRQWEKAGRKVKEGTHAFYILGPIVHKIKEKDKTTGVEVERVFVSGFRGIPVFRFEDTEQIDGDSTWEDNFTPAEFPPLFDVAQKLGLSVAYAERTDLATFRGYYSPTEERILLLTHDVRTFFHELGHAAHKRVLEDKGKKMKGGQDKGQEIVAETVAATLCYLYGYDGYLWEGAEYVKNYADQDKNPGRAAMKVLSEVQATLELIMSLASDVPAENTEEAVTTAG